MDHASGTASQLLLPFPLLFTLSKPARLEVNICMRLQWCLLRFSVISFAFFFFFLKVFTECEPAEQFKQEVPDAYCQVVQTDTHALVSWSTRAAPTHIDLSADTPDPAGHVVHTVLLQSVLF